MYYMKSCVQGGKSFHLLFLFAGDDCEFLEVTEGRSAINGLYVKSDEIELFAAPNNSVWRHPDNNRYIFNTGNTEGWRIGKKSHLSTTQDFYYKGEN